MRRILSELDLGGTLLYRALTLGVSLAASLLVVAILTQRFGVGTYAAFVLLASLLNLLPFADLGLGATVLNAVSDARAGAITSDAARFHVSRARDVLVVVALAIGAASLILLGTGLWGPVLGTVAAEPGVDVAASFTLCCVAAAIPFALGSRILQG